MNTLKIRGIIFIARAHTHTHKDTYTHYYTYTHTILIFNMFNKYLMKEEKEKERGQAD